MVPHLPRWTSISAFAIALAAPWPSPAAAQESEIRTIADALPGVLGDGDVDGLMDLFTADVVFLHPLLPAIVGKDSMRTFVEEVFRQQSASSTSIEVETVQVSGDWAHLVARFQTLWTPTDGSSPFRERARYLWVLRRDATGAWRVRSFVFYPVT